MAQFVLACRTAEVVEGRARAVEVDGLRLAIYRDHGTFTAIQARCPHASASLAHGWVEDGQAVCPLHHWHFRLRDGVGTTVRGSSVHRFRCEVRGDEIWVEV